MKRFFLYEDKDAFGVNSFAPINQSITWERRMGPVGPRDTFSLTIPRNSIKVEVNKEQGIIA